MAGVRLRFTSAVAALWGIGLLRPSAFAGLCRQSRWNAARSLHVKHRETYVSAAPLVPRAAKSKGFGASGPATGKTNAKAAPKPTTPKGCRSVMVTGRDGSTWQVLIGKTAEDNDRLSLQYGKPDEVWMHAASVPGSHAVVRAVEEWQESLPPPRDVVQKAAAMCAFYSKAKTQRSVEVHVSTCAQVSKSKSSPAGQVLLKRPWTSVKVTPQSPETVSKT